MDIFFCKINKNQSNLISKRILTKRAIQRLKKTTHPKKRLHIMYSDLLIQYVLFKKQRMKYPLSITYNMRGKPLLSKGFFNISNCNEWVMCTYSNNAAVGADIEEYKRCNHELAQFFFTQEELKHLLTLSQREQINFFTDSWTFKESYVKCKGISLFDIKNNIHSPLVRNYFIKDYTEIEGELFHYVRGVIENYSWCLLSEENFTKYNIKLVCYSQIIETLTNIYRGNYAEHLHD
ncbi:phosphopantetheinyl transferase [Bacillus cereus]|nr:phosphopantetheinyl transferase [Bacillus cereus]PEX40057.1 phosphopantetheinyl transferase [Bacillus cereus]PFB16548.1 phosphopantetheinyl transferase [Bacillus cereus]PFP60622.1 phosphopantetheinyl transferase [Bacillus cereus]PFV60203.1 phosphopantetheinyl transferase [Bacillus cereus]